MQTVACFNAAITNWSLNEGEEGRDNWGVGGRDALGTWEPEENILTVRFLPRKRKY